MKNIFRNIILILITGLFIISSTGVYLTIHYCRAEDITGLFLFTLLTEEPCEHHAGNHNNNGCCSNSFDNKAGYETIFSCENLSHIDSNSSLSYEMPECCSNTILYIAVEDDFFKTVQTVIKISSNLLPTIFGLNTIEADVNSANFSLITNKEPPPKLYGKELAFFNRILLL